MVYHVKQKQPEERIRKHIIVSIWYRGKTRWVLAPAIKDGNNYKVDYSVFVHLSNSLDVVPYTTCTLG